MMLPIASAALPTQGILSYGYQRSPTHAHNGVDMPAPEGTPVYAAADGAAVIASKEWRQGFSGYGRVVVLHHPQHGVWTLYAHLAEPAVAQGQLVKAGEVIGYVGRTQYAPDDHSSMTGAPHLHFEVSDRPYPMPSTQPRIDPVAWLGNAAQPSIEPSPVIAPKEPQRGIPFGRSRSRVHCPSCGCSLVLTEGNADD
jgi:murein DD-endopeptidase MepM/ murein hydrolase activator NlpD